MADKKYRDLERELANGGVNPEKLANFLRKGRREGIEDEVIAELRGYTDEFQRAALRLTE